MHRINLVYSPMGSVKAISIKMGKLNITSVYTFMSHTKLLFRKSRNVRNVLLASPFNLILKSLHSGPQISGNIVYLFDLPYISHCYLFMEFLPSDVYDTLSKKLWNDNVSKKVCNQAKKTREILMFFFWHMWFHFHFFQSTLLSIPLIGI